jgi:aryl-alcohol dehydrogenase-like predicted oxidoreductase
MHSLLLTSVVEVITNALDQGCNYFDTAEAYDNGASEKALGDVLKQVEKRDQAVIGRVVQKLKLNFSGTKILPGNCAPKIMREHLQKSLERLQVTT